jgi:1,4-dihydroxy-2-naphthoyl-CoA synthase
MSRCLDITGKDPMDFEDLLYEIRNGVAWITINRPDKMNAFRGTTCDELIRALNKAGYDKSVGCIVLAGAGDRPSAPAATSRRTTATTTAAAPSACRWRNCTTPSATCPSP